MQISYQTIIGLIYSIGMMSVLLRGYFVYELGMESYITITGQIISIVQIGITFILIFSHKNEKLNKKPIDIIILRRALMLFWGIIVVFGLINSYTVSTSMIYFIVMTLTLLTINYKYSFFERLIYLTFYTFFLMCLLSLIFMYFGYGIDVNGEYNVVSAIGVRLYGFTQHANTLGPIAALVCIYSYYNKKNLSFIIGIITLWYTQSKTNIFILLICIIMDVFKRLLNYINKRKIKYLYSMFITCGIFLILIIIYYLVYSQFGFTGRISTWEYYLSAWTSNIKNIIIGANSSLVYLHKYSENMYVDMITKYGIIGMSSFIFLLFVIFKISWRNMREGYNLSFPIFIFIVIRSITESIFISTNMAFGDFFNLVFLIIIQETYLRSNDIREKNEKIKEEFN